MAGLQRSSETFRRSGSSGLVWEDRHLPGEMNSNTSKPIEKLDGDPVSLRSSQSVGAVGMMRRTRSTGGGGGGGGGGVKAYRVDQVAPAMDPPSPKVSCCGAFCGDFSKTGSKRKGKTRRR